MPEADALREARLMGTVKTPVNGAKEPKEQALSLAVAPIERQVGKGLSCAASACPKGSQAIGVRLRVLHPGAVSPDCNASCFVASGPHSRNSML